MISFPFILKLSLFLLDVLKKIKKNKKKCWFLPTAADSLCANLMSHPSCSDVGVKKAPA